MKHSDFISVGDWKINIAHIMAIRKKGKTEETKEMGDFETVIYLSREFAIHCPESSEEIEALISSARKEGK